MVTLTYMRTQALKGDLYSDETQGPMDRISQSGSSPIRVEVGELWRQDSTVVVRRASMKASLCLSDCTSTSTCTCHRRPSLWHRKLFATPVVGMVQELANVQSA